MRVIHTQATKAAALCSALLLLFWTTRPGYTAIQGYYFLPKSRSSTHEAQTALESLENTDKIVTSSPLVSTVSQNTHWTASSALEAGNLLPQNYPAASIQASRPPSSFEHTESISSLITTTAYLRIATSQNKKLESSIGGSVSVTVTKTANDDIPMSESRTFERPNELNKIVQDIGEQTTASPAEDSQGIPDFNITHYVDSILDLSNNKIPRLACPGEQSQGLRYEVLRKSTDQRGFGVKYLFALDLYQSIGVLPRLLSSIIQATRHLGPENCGLSIVEGLSKDGTYEVLESLRDPLSALGVHYWLIHSGTDSKAEGNERTQELANLRNIALNPLLNEAGTFSESPLFIFLNDIVVCPDDILEIIYQHQLQGAVQTCAMDWIEKGKDFYDVWASRSMSGNTFWEIPQDGSWAFSQNLFHDHPLSKDKYNRSMPFQTFSCWGGMTVMDAVPFMKGLLRFRRNVEGECYGGVPQLLGMDLARLGLSRVQTLPQVNVGYSDEEGAEVKRLRGYVHEKVDTTNQVKQYEDDTVTERIRWKEPPHKIRCMPEFGDSWWVNSVYKPGEEEDKDSAYYDSRDQAQFRPGATSCETAPKSVLERLHEERLAYLAHDRLPVPGE